MGIFMSLSVRRSAQHPAPSRVLWLKCECVDDHLFTVHAYPLIYLPRHQVGALLDRSALMRYPLMEHSRIVAYISRMQEQWGYPGSAVVGSVQRKLFEMEWIEEVPSNMPTSMDTFPHKPSIGVAYLRTQLNPYMMQLYIRHIRVTADGRRGGWDSRTVPATSPHTCICAYITTCTYYMTRRANPFKYLRNGPDRFCGTPGREMSACIV